MIETIKKKISGKKTYIVCIGAVISIVLAWSSHMMGDVEAIQSVIAAIVAMTIRDGISAKKKK